jgi:hypothetical protein
MPELVLLDSKRTAKDKFEKQQDRSAGRRAKQK